MRNRARAIEATLIETNEAGTAYLVRTSDGRQGWIPPYAYSNGLIPTEYEKDLMTEEERRIKKLKLRGWRSEQVPLDGLVDKVEDGKYHISVLATRDGQITGESVSFEIENSVAWESKVPRWMLQDAIRKEIARLAREPGVYQADIPHLGIYIRYRAR